MSSSPTSIGFSSYLGSFRPPAFVDFVEKCKNKIWGTVHQKNLLMLSCKVIIQTPEGSSKKYTKLFLKTSFLVWFTVTEINGVNTS